MAWIDRFAGPQLEIFTPAFWEGREFRTYKELNIPLGQTYVIKVVVPVDVTFYGLELAVDAGFLRMGTYAGGTAGGVFSETLPRFCTNNMTPGTNHKNSYPTPPPGIYLPQVTLTAGGTHTGGIELDVQRIRNPSKTDQRLTIGVGSNGLGSPRGIATGTYYFRLQAIEAVTGVFRATWEERP